MDLELVSIEITYTNVTEDVGWGLITELVLVMQLVTVSLPSID